MIRWGVYGVRDSLVSVLLPRCFLVRGYNGPEWADPVFRKAHMFGPEDMGTFWYMAVSSYLFIGILGLWVVIALYLGKTYQKAVDEAKIVC
jgi:hypothetical protein